MSATRIGDPINGATLAARRDVAPPSAISAHLAFGSTSSGPNGFRNVDRTPQNLSLWTASPSATAPGLRAATT